MKSGGRSMAGLGAEESHRGQGTDGAFQEGGGSAAHPQTWHSTRRIMVFVQKGQFRKALLQFAGGRRRPEQSGQSRTLRPEERAGGEDAWPGALSIWGRKEGGGERRGRGWTGSEAAGYGIGTARSMEGPVWRLLAPRLARNER